MDFILFVVLVTSIIAAPLCESYAYDFVGYYEVHALIIVVAISLTAACYLAVKMKLTKRGGMAFMAITGVLINLLYVLAIVRFLLIPSISE